MERSTRGQIAAAVKASAAAAAATADVRRWEKEWRPASGRADLKVFAWVPKTERNVFAPVDNHANQKLSEPSSRRLGLTITHRQSNAWQGTRRSSRGMGLPAEHFGDDDARGAMPTPPRGPSPVVAAPVDEAPSAADDDEQGDTKRFKTDNSRGASE